MENTIERTAEIDKQEILNLSKSKRQPSKPFRRKTYLIDSDVQTAIARQFLLLALCAGALGLGNVLVIDRLLAVDPVDGLEMAIIYGYCAVLIGISLGLVTLMSIFLSHRVAGPAWNMNRALRRAAAGDLWLKVHLREHDLFVELARSFNSAMRTWRTTLTGIDFEMRRLRQAAQGNPELASSLQRLEKLLSEYELTPPSERDGNNS